MYLQDLKLSVNTSAIEMQRDLYICFIDYTKAFDKVKHEELINKLEKLNLDGKDLRTIKNIYWQQTAAIKVDQQIGPYQNIKMGVRQGCVFSPDLFNLYSDYIMRAIDNIPGIVVGGYNLNNLRFADDTALVASDQNNLQKMVNTITEESEKMGLSLNTNKTEVMTISKEKEPPKCTIKLKGHH